MRSVVFIIFALASISAAHADHCIPRMKEPQGVIAAARADGKAALQRNDTAAACAAAKRAEAAQEQILNIGQDASCFHAPSKPGPRGTNSFTALVKELCSSGSSADKPRARECNPKATVESKSETNPKNTYEVIVINNDCPYKVRFSYKSEPVGSGTAREYRTFCAPANTSRFETNRSSSTSMARLSVVGPASRCD